MIEIRNAKTVGGRRIDVSIESDQKWVIQADAWTLFPALIDPHVHFRVPGASHKEDWTTGAKAAIAGGVTMVFDMPNNHPPCTTLERMEEKIGLIERELKTIPLRYGLYLGADRSSLKEIPRVKKKAIGLKIYMGSSTGGLLMDDRASLEEAFQLAAENDLLVAVHAEDEQLIQLHRKKYADRTDAATHSLVRNATVAAKAVELAIDLAKRHKAKLYIVHTSTREELSLIRQAKKEGISVFAEAAPHHLFLNESDYEWLGTKALVNPPLRTARDNEALWEAIDDETIDTVGTDHAPHTLEEKMQPYGKAPSGFPAIELYFPLLLNAAREGKLSLERIVSLTHTRPLEIFGLPSNDDVVLVDLEKQKTIDDTCLHTKVQWSPYAGRTVIGWPVMTIMKGHVYEVDKL
ncbi:MAG: dihydroorotase [Verrucomicrobiota bacterium]|nr:dihydroorotase [Verrucomicrobiota bacterium]